MKRIFTSITAAAALLGSAAAVRAQDPLDIAFTVHSGRVQYLLAGGAEGI